MALTPHPTLTLNKKIYSLEVSPWWAWLNVQLFDHMSWTSMCSKTCRNHYVQSHNCTVQLNSAGTLFCDYRHNLCFVRRVQDFAIYTLEMV